MYPFAYPVLHRTRRINFIQRPYRGQTITLRAFTNALINLFENRWIIVCPLTDHPHAGINYFVILQTYSSYNEPFCTTKQLFE